MITKIQIQDAWKRYCSTLAQVSAHSLPTPLDRDPSGLWLIPNRRYAGLGSARSGASRSKTVQLICTQTEHGQVPGGELHAANDGGDPVGDSARNPADSNQPRSAA